MKLALAAAALCFACAAAATDLALDLRLDPASRELDAVAEIADAPPDFRFALRAGLSVRGVTRLDSGRLRIEYGGVLPQSMVSELASYLPAGSGWYPQPDALFTYQVNLQVSHGQKALVPGRLVSESEKDGVYRAVFEYEAPAEGIALMAGPYRITERFAALPERRRVRLRTYFFPGMEALAEPYLQDSAGYLERYSDAIGVYPFQSFSIVASRLPSGLGMPTLTYIGERVLRLPFIRASSLGHEVLHNWWGNGVLVDAAGGNWAEGLTTFMADYAYKEDASPAAARDMRLGWLRDLAALPPGGAKPLAEFRERAHGADAVTGYGKAAMVFFMLRDLIGEEAFSRGIQRFWEAKRFERASWDDLRAAFEGAAGRDLRVFFSQWLERAGAPAVRIASADARGFVLEQGSPAYTLRLPVELAFEHRSEVLRVDMARERQSIRWPNGAMPKAVRLDPDLRVYRRLEAGELPPILRQWIIARRPGLMDVSSIGRSLARRFFESSFRLVDEPTGEPLLIVGLHADVDAALARLGLPARPAEVAGRGTAQVWTIPGTEVAVISAEDEDALEALARPLPHYGAQSWLVFEGARAVAHGSWPPAPRVVVPE